jgi:conjugal transfer pilus assembly protein TraD
MQQDMSSKSVFMVEKLKGLQSELKRVQKLSQSGSSPIEISSDEIKDIEEAIYEEISKVHDHFIDISKGLYLGIGYDLESQVSSESLSPIPLYVPWKTLHSHMGFKGTTRVGKTQNMLSHIKQLIKRGDDVVVIDPKGGENQEVVSAICEFAYKSSRFEEILYFSPAFPKISQKVNILYGRSNLEISSMVIDAIAEPDIESFYLEISTRIILAITTAFEYLQKETDPDGEITRYLEAKERAKYFSDAAYISSYSKSQCLQLEELSQKSFNRTLITFKELEHYCSYSGLEKLLHTVETIYQNRKSQSGSQELYLDAKRVLNSSLKSDTRHFSKVSDTLANRLIQLSTGEIGQMLCGTRINPLVDRLVNRGAGVITIVQPFPMKFKRASYMFNRALLSMFNSILGEVGATGEMLPRRVNLFIDEAGTIVYPGIESFFNRAGGLGVSCFVYTQSDEDYKEALGETLSNVVLDNVNTKGIMRQNLYQSALNCANDIGMNYSYKTIAMISAGGEDGRYTSDIKDEYICTPSDIQALPVGEGIVISDGKKYYVEFPTISKSSVIVEMSKPGYEKI